MKKFRAAVAAVLVTALALTGCSSNKKETEAPKETQAPVVEEASEAVSEAAAVAETEAAAAVEAAITEAEAAVETAATEAVEAAEAVETEAAPAVEAVMTEAEEAVAAVETEVAEAVEEVLTEAEEAAAVVETEAEAAAAVAETEAEATEVGNGVEVRACIASEPETLDPNLESSVDGATYAMHLFEGLMKYDMTDDNASDNNDNLKLIMPGYGQAESYEVSEDGLTYTFTLRDDIVWSDGQPVTAADFEYSWKRIVDPANAADYGYLLGGIVENAAAIPAGEAEPDTLGIKAIDDKTLEIKLEAECPYFLGICAFAALMPLRQDVIEEFGNEWTNPENMVTNGAYVLTDWQHDSYLEMTRSATYYGGGNGPSKITWYLSDSQTNQLASYQADEYDFFDDLPVDQIASLRESGDAFSADQVGTYYLYMHTKNIPDWRVRAAIALCIDRENIVENVTQGGQVPATGITAAGITNSEGTEWTEYVGEPMYNWLAENYPDADLETYSGRCDLAVQLVEEAVADGYDKDATIDYEFNTSESHKAIAEAVQSDVDSVLGLQMALNNSEWQTYTNNLGEGKFGLARLGWIADYDDASTYIELFTNGNSYNYGEWENDEYTDLVNQAKALPGGAERDELLAKAENLLFAEDGWTVCPLYFYTQQYCLKNLKNVGWTPLGYFIFSYAEAAE